MTATLAGACKAVASEAPAIIIENVPGFPDELAVQAYGNMYNWQSFVLDPSDVGFEFIARQRTEHELSADVA